MHGYIWLQDKGVLKSPVGKIAAPVVIGLGAGEAGAALAGYVDKELPHGATSDRRTRGAVVGGIAGGAVAGFVGAIVIGSGVGLVAAVGIGALWGAYRGYQKVVERTS